ncbi:unnamed protein product [Protopolystoma xenopodis]|uniref:Uncharacterized protein n=1 Tax=Protopolystoma xenopodis TaxID=117903 RepID=A0A3S5CFP9_9PLAT|nr:unnamed protein product [Protopolystoma xenopodis]
MQVSVGMNNDSIDPSKSTIQAGVCPTPSTGQPRAISLTLGDFSTSLSAPLDEALARNGRETDTGGTPSGASIPPPDPAWESESLKYDVLAELTSNSSRRVSRVTFAPEPEVFITRACSFYTI